MPARTPSSLMYTSTSSPSCRRANRSRNSILSRNSQVESTCSSGNGGWLGETPCAQVQHHRRILADRMQQHGPREIGGDLAEDVDALGFELPEVRDAEVREGWHGLIVLVERDFT